MVNSDKGIKSSKGINSQETIVKTAVLMKRMFRAPNPSMISIPILLISLLTGTILSLNSINFYNSIIVNSFLILAIPTFLSSIFSKLIAEYLGGIFYLRRSMLLSFVCLIIICFVIIIGKFIFIPFFNINNNIVLIFAYSSITWLRLIVFITTSNSSYIRSLPPALFQSTIGVTFILTLGPFRTSDLMFLIFSNLIFIFSAYLFIKLVDAPMKKNFGVSGIKLMRYFIAHVTDTKDQSSTEIEEFFGSFSEKMDVPLTVIGFKAKNKIKSLMIIPTIHPGPFGKIGGGDLPSKLLDGLNDITNNIFVPHGASNHDYNLVYSKDCKLIIKEARNLIKELDYKKGGSKFIRKHDDIEICAQYLGDALLLVHTSSPNPTDDIDPAIGQMVLCEMVKDRNKKPVFLDAHNCIEIGSGCVFFNTPKANKIIELAKKAAKQANNNKTDKISMGYSQIKGFDIKNDGIGPQGIQAITIVSNNQRNSYVLIDGNNMIKGLREELIKNLKSSLDEIEILTSDNHIVNVKIGGYNPIGLKMDKRKFFDIIQDLIKKSIDELEEVAVGIKSGVVKGIRLFGYGNTARITATINSITSNLRKNTLLTLILAFLLIIFYYIIII
jgi:putative membrane protein